MYNDSTAPGGSAYTREVAYGEALQLFFGNYIKFEGRSNRGEFWKAALCLFGIGIVCNIVDMMLFGNSDIQIVGAIWSLVTLVPGIALGVRRLHDIGRSGWWYLIILVPLIGFLVLIYWFVQKPDPAPNRFG